MNFDFHPTPSHVADRLVGYVENELPKTVADFSAGAGSLLLAAQKRWPHAKKIATDIQGGMVGKIRSSFPAWDAGRCDFLNRASVRSCKALRGREGAVDVILLNPPFALSERKSSIGGGGRDPTVALQFLERATHYGSPGAEICAILPDSCLYNEKDEGVRKLIEMRWVLRNLGRPGRKTFSDCSAESTIVHLRRRSGQDTRHVVEASANPKIQLVRGITHVHAANRSSCVSAMPMVHSTNLREGRICGDMDTVLSNNFFEGPAVFVHRVGRPSPQKVSVFDGRMRVVLSDCVIALPTRSLSDAVSLRNRIVDNFELLASAYIGTGAPFITLGRLREVLHRMGGF